MLKSSESSIPSLREYMATHQSGAADEFLTEATTLLVKGHLLDPFRGTGGPTWMGRIHARTFLLEERGHGLLVPYGVLWDLAQMWYGLPRDPMKVRAGHTQAFEDLVEAFGLPPLALPARTPILALDPQLDEEARGPFRRENVYVTTLDMWPCSPWAEVYEILEERINRGRS